MGNFTRMQKVVILIIVTVITLTLSYKIFINNDKDDITIEDNALFEEEKIENKKDEEEIFLQESKEENKEQEEKVQTHVVVHVTGEVSKPGVVTLENESRVIDAIKKSGGLLPSADESKINLAQKLFDEDKVIIPKIGDDLELETSNIESKDNKPINTQNTQKQDERVVTSKNRDNTNSSTNQNTGGGININTASQEELKTLPGIGEVTSQKIIDYRESTPFNSIEDIKNVSGIGEKKFEAIQSMIMTR